MIAEQLTDEQYRDGLALLRLRDKHPEAWEAIERTVKGLGDDLIRRWSADDSGKLKRKWLRGAQEANDALLPALLASMEATTGALEERQQEKKEKEDEKVSGRVPSQDGVGSGDLAL